MVKIENVVKVKNLIISGFIICEVHVNLYNSVNLRIMLQDESDNPVDVLNMTIDGEDYANWSSDDDYIVNYVANKLGFTIIN